MTRIPLHISICIILIYPITASAGEIDPPFSVESLASRLHFDTSQTQLVSGQVIKESNTKDNVIIVPPDRKMSATLQEMEKGFFLGQWIVRKDILLGRSGGEKLKANTYNAWLAKPSGIWSIIFSDSSGSIVSYTTEVVMGIDKNVTDPLFSRIRIRTIEPPYPLSDVRGKYLRNKKGAAIVRVADIITDPLMPDTGDYAETPCQPAYRTRWVKIDNPYSGDSSKSTICHGYRECIYCCN